MAKSAQTETLSKLVLRCKQAIWAGRETARVREMDSTLATVEGLIEKELDRGLLDLEARLERGEIGQVGFVEDQKALRADRDMNVRNVREAFRVASGGEVQERVFSSLSFFFSWRAYIYKPRC